MRSPAEPRRVLCVVQARTGSSRLPGKVLADVAGRPMLRFMLDRLEPLAMEVVVATSTEERDDAVAGIAYDAGRAVVRGSEGDVLDRFVTALDTYPAQHVVRLTADCPLIDPQLVAAVVERHLATRADYTTNTLPRTFPKGLDVEVLSADALRVAHDEACTAAEREHVTPFVYRRPERFRLANLRHTEPLGHERWTVDTPDDLVFVRDVCDRMPADATWSWRDVLAVVGRHVVAAPGAVVLRPAYPCDADFVRDCRSDADAVRHSASGSCIGAADHARWFACRLDDPGNPLWIGTVDGEPVGTVRLDVRRGVGEVGIAVQAASRGHGYGTGILLALLDEVRGGQHVVELTARVHTGNTASQRAFATAGFERYGGDGPFDFLRRDPRMPIEEP